MKKLTELRNELKISQTDLAAKIGVSQQTISKYENGSREPNLTTLFNLARFFNVSTDYLLDNTVFVPSNNETQALNWNMVLEEYPNALCVSPEEEDLISYYQKLSLEDKRWIMGQMIDLLRRSDIKSNPRKAQ